MIFPPSNQNILYIRYTCLFHKYFSLTDCFLKETEDMLLVQHDQTFLWFDAFVDGIQTLSICFQHIVLQCKKHVHIHVVRHHVKQRMNLSKEIRKNFHLGRQTFRLLTYLQVGPSEEKTRFLGDVPIAVCSLYIFPPICPSSTPPKKIDILRLFPPPEEVHQSTLCR